MCPLGTEHDHGRYCLPASRIPGSAKTRSSNDAKELTGASPTVAGVVAALEQTAARVPRILPACHRQRYEQSATQATEHVWQS